MVTNVVFVLITCCNFEIPSWHSSVGVTEGNIYEDYLNYGSTCMESLLYGFKNPLVLSESLNYCESCIKFYFNLLKPNDIYIYIYIYIYMSYRSPNLQTLHFKYLFNKYTY